MAKVSVGARVVRAVFIGFTIGIFGFLGFYLLATGVNLLANSTVINPIACGMFALGGAVVGAIGVELSKDIAESKQE